MASIVYSEKKLKRRSIQIISFVVILIYIIVVNFKVLFSYELLLEEISSNESLFQINQTKKKICDYKDLNTRIILSYIDLFNRMILPFPFMIFTTAWLIYKIIFLRKKVISANRPDKNFFKRFWLSATTVSFNLIYLFLNLPQIVGWLLPQYNMSENAFSYLIVSYISLVSYAINFIVLFISNRLFRQQLFLLFKLNKPKKTILTH